MSRSGKTMTKRNFLPLLALAVVSCGGGAPPPVVTVVDTLPSGTLVATSGEQGSWAAGLDEPWTPEIMTRIGSAAAREEAEIFSVIRGVAVDALDRIYILEGQAAEVRVFDLQGRHLRTMGRRGQGPGELLRPSGMVFSPDGDLWITDPGNGRIQIFDTAGVDRGSVSMSRVQSASASGWGLDAQGYLRVTSRTQGGFFLVRADPASGSPLDSLPLPPDDTDRFILTRTDNGQVTGVGIYSIPFAPERMWGFWEDRLWTANGDAYEMAAMGLSSGLDTTLVVRRTVARDPVDPSELEGYWESVRLTPQEVRRLDLSKVPELKRSFERFFVDRDGYLWVSRWAPGVFGSRQSAERPFDVFNSDGTFLGTLTLPMKPSPTPWVRGDLLVGVHADELDVPVVVVYRIGGRQVKQGERRR